VPHGALICTSVDIEHEMEENHTRKFRYPDE
jgi:hypothetical protein